jgi:aminocarboxymuconate-semialdehyde decarboxylase
MDIARLSRRRFVVSGSAAAAACLSAPRLFAAARQAPKRILVAGRPVRVVDIHAHCVVPAVADIVRGTPLATDDFPRNQILGPERLQAMDQRGIDVQVLSVNQYWWYDAERPLAERITRTQDEGVAAWCRANPRRFVGLSAVSLQFPELAAEQLDYAVRTLGLRGATIGGTVRGEVPSTAKYDVFWRKAEELQAPIFMHPVNGDAILRENALEGRGDLGNIIGNPLETTVFLSKLIFDGTLDRFPGLKVCGSHGGGYLPSYFMRTEVACQVRNNARCANTRPPRAYLRTQIMADSMVFSAEALRHLVAEMGPRQIVYGTDMPFNWPDTADLIASADFLSNADKEAILGGTLISLLKIA